MGNVPGTLTAKAIEYATMANVIAQVKINHTIIEQIFKLDNNPILHTKVDYLLSDQ